MVTVAILLLAEIPQAFAASGDDRLSNMQGVVAERMLAQSQPGVTDSVEREVPQLSRQADAFENSGDYGEAARLWERILAIKEKTLGQEHPDTAASLNNLASLYLRQGKYVQVEPLIRRALEIYQKVRGADHLDTAIGLNNLAAFYVYQGRYGDAEALYKRSLGIVERSPGLSGPEVAAVLINIADLYVVQGRYAEGERFCKSAISIYDRSKEVEGFDMGRALEVLAKTYYGQGRYGEAEFLYRRALLAFEKALGAAHPDVATVLNNLALLYASSGRHLEAVELYRRVLAIDEKALGLEHPSTNTALHNLAAAYDGQGLYGEAEPLYKRALSVSERILGRDHPSTASGLNNLAVLYHDMGRYGEAESFAMRALAIVEKAFGPEHPYVFISLNNVAKQHLLQGQPAAGLSLVGRLNLAQAGWLHRELPLQPRELRMALIQAQPDAIATTFDLLHQDPSSAPLALEVRLSRQGLLAEIEQRQQQLATSSPPTRDLAERIAGLDRQLASVSLPSERRPVLRQERQQLEAELFRALPNLRLEAVTVPQVAAALKSLAPAGVLVEFQKYRPLLRDAGKGKPGWGSSRYVALLLRPDGRVSSVQLGEAKPIDAAIAQALQASADNNGDALELWGRIGSLLFKPLQSQLGGVRQLFLSPDSELNRVPFAALPVPGQSKQLLGEVLQLRVLTTGRDLLRLQQSLPASGPAALIANPDYDRKDGVPATTDAANSIASLDIPTSSGVRSQQRSSDLDGSKPWKPLPATAQEAKLLAPLLQVTQPISGSQATVTRTLQLKAPRILHIATHGFFEADQQAAAKDAGPFRSLADRQDPGAGRQEDPLLRSGLVLAGANHPQADPKDDGYLTAAEATGLQLEGTELVTLSACETGLGALRSGEGVYGLQRALTVAGARSTLLSLWKVNDDATAEFMVRFYKRLKAGEGRAEALVATQKEFRDGLPGHPDWMQPYYWAAWQLVGDWRPMARP